MCKECGCQTTTSTEKGAKSSPGYDHAHVGARRPARLAPT